jgi:hypothetical protein
MENDAAVAAYRVAQPGQVQDALARRKEAAGKMRTAMQEMENAGMTKDAARAAMDRVDDTEPTPHNVKFALNFPNPDPTRPGGIIVRSDTEQIFTPVKVLPHDDTMRPPEHLWAPAMHAIIKHDAAREFLHNKRIFSENGVAGMSAGSWVKAVWPQLAPWQQYEVRNAIIGSARLSHLLNPNKAMLRHPGPERPLSIEQELRAQIAQLQALNLQLSVQQRRAPDDEPRVVEDEPVVLGTRMREERDAELLKDAVDVDPSPKRAKAGPP